MPSRLQDRSVTRNLDPHATVYDHHGECAQRLLASNYIEDLNARWEVRPVDDLTRSYIETRAMQRTLHFAILKELAPRKGCQDVRTACLGREESIAQMIEQNLPTAHVEWLHVTDVEFIDTTDSMHCHNEFSHECPYDLTTRSYL